MLRCPEAKRATSNVRRGKERGNGGGERNKQMVKMWNVTAETKASAPDISCLCSCLCLCQFCQCEDKPPSLRVHALKSLCGIPGVCAILYSTLLMYTFKWHDLQPLLQLKASRGCDARGWTYLLQSRAQFHCLQWPQTSSDQIRWPKSFSAPKAIHMVASARGTNTRWESPCKEWKRERECTWYRKIYLKQDN